jgi:hypothetical protein
MREDTVFLDGQTKIKCAAPSEMIINYEPEGETPLILEIKENQIILKPWEKTVEIGGRKRSLINGGPVRILTDSASVEIFIGGEASVTYAIDTEGLELFLKGKGKINAQYWELSPVW